MSNIYIISKKSQIYFLRDNPDWVVTSFIESPPMSSYLLALAVTDFHYIEGTTSMGTRVCDIEYPNLLYYFILCDISLIFYHMSYNIVPFKQKA